MAVTSARFGSYLAALAGGATARQLARWSQLVRDVAALESGLVPLDDQQLRKQSLSLRYRAKSGVPLAELVVEAYALVREAARRSLGMRHYDVQILGGLAMHFRSIAEMQTGEGKTLTATLPMYVAALSGKGAHLATANDYLARRDADLMRPVYEALGLTIGVVEDQMPRPQRRQAYQCDITYGTAREFGFDFLRDRLLERNRDEGSRNLLGSLLGHTNDNRGEEPVQRPPHFALIDEADSILIDEARTPLVISAVPGEQQQAELELYRWAASVVGQFESLDDYERDAQRRLVSLTPRGRRKVREIPKPAPLDWFDLYEIYEATERAIRVERDYLLDRHYILRDGEVVIVDEFTGRLAEGRRWRAGIHQAIEAKEGVDISPNSGQAARITVQDFFHRYPQLAGMTGTVANSGGELKRIYGLRCVAIPTNRPAIRQQWPDRVFATADAKWQAIVAEIGEVHATGRPLLIGTRSIDKSEILSDLLRAAGIPHQVLNARHVAAEAEIVAAAGQQGRVTVSTNMAGRGTDVKLGVGVHTLGGMHVICTELHDSARVDRQLVGRCGRQGDPGTFRQYLALDDDILASGLGVRRAEQLRRQGTIGSGRYDRLAPLFYRAQAKIEREHFRGRRLLMHHERQRHEMQVQMGQDPYLDAPE